MLFFIYLFCFSSKKITFLMAVSLDPTLNGQIYTEANYHERHNCSEKKKFEFLVSCRER